MENLSERMGTDGYILLVVHGINTRTSLNGKVSNMIIAQRANVSEDMQETFLEDSGYYHHCDKTANF